MKPNLIFLHGGPGVKDYLRPFFEDLSDSFHLHFYDQLQGPLITIEDLLLQLDELASSITGPIVIAGHSWGGVLGAEYAIRNPDKVHGLVLMNTCLCFTHWSEEFQKEKKLLGLTNSEPEFVFLTEEERNEGKVFLEETWKTFSGETFDSLYDSFVRGFDLRDKVKTLPIPVYLVFSSHDVRFPARLSRGLMQDESCLEVINAGHFPFLRPSGRKMIHDFLRMKLRPMET